MPNPVLDRIMFQVLNPSGSSQGTPAPKPKAKGTGITSMVTSPDTGAQELRSFANPNIQPTVSGFADGGMAGDGYNNFSAVQYGPDDRGIPESVFQFDTPLIAGTEIGGRGFFGGEQLPPTPYGVQGQNPGWGHEGQPMVMSREPVPLGLGPEYQEWAKQHASTSSGGPLEAAVSQATGTTVTAPTNNSAPAPSSRYKFDASKFMQGSVSPTAGVQTPYDMGNRVSEAQMRGIASVPQPTGNFYQPSFADIPQGYADGGPVQHFQQGGPAVASMWDNFVNSLTIKGETKSPFQGPTPMRKENYQRPGLPDIGLRIGQQSDYRKDAGITGGGANYVEPIDVGGQNAEPPVPNVDAERRQLGQSIERFFNPTPEELAAQQAKMEEQRNRLLASGVNSEDVSRMFPRPREEAPSRIDDREAARGAGFRNIEEQPRPPMPSPGIQTETTVNPGASSGGGGGGGSIATQLAQIKAERNAQSAADRRENALMALMSAGFGMAAGKSRHALANIAEGGQQGIATFANLEKGRREDDNRRYLAELQERELRMNEPYRAAMTRQAEAQSAYLRARPGIDKARLDQAKEIAVTKSTMRAEEQVMKEVKDSPQNYMLPNGKRDQMKIDAEIEKRKSSIYPSVFYDTLNGGRQTDNSSGE